MHSRILISGFFRPSVPASVPASVPLSVPLSVPHPQSVPPSIPPSVLPSIRPSLHPSLRPMVFITFSSYSFYHEFTLPFLAWEHNSRLGCVEKKMPYHFSYFRSLGISLRAELWMMILNQLSLHLPKRRHLLIRPSVHQSPFTAATLPPGEKTQNYLVASKYKNIMILRELNDKPDQNALLLTQSYNFFSFCFLSFWIRNERGNKTFLWI